MSGCTLFLAQLLVRKPRWIIADELKAQLNERDRKLVLALFENELSQAALISITSNDLQPEFYSCVVRLVTRE